MRLFIPIAILSFLLLMTVNTMRQLNPICIPIGERLNFEVEKHFCHLKYLNFVYSPASNLIMIQNRVRPEYVEKYYIIFQGQLGERNKQHAAQRARGEYTKRRRPAEREQQC